MKYILVTGGVLSGIGKGVIASSIGTMLKAFSFRVTSIKIDPYINIDAGTFSPYEHGEVFVLEDGGEVDLDLGNYERFLDITLHKDNNITTGKIYQHVIERERRGDYLGKTVQIVPHITNAIQDWVQRVAHIPVDEDQNEPEICVIELGGTIGDIEGMPFVEAFRQFTRRVGRENLCCIHVSLVPLQKSTGELKTKPTQRSIEALRGRGILPDMIICRSDSPISKEVREKVAEFSDLALEQVLYCHDVSSIYMVPLALEEQGLAKFFANRLSLNLPHIPTKNLLRKWRDLAERHDNPINEEVTIALVGKYTKLRDSYTSVNKALLHSALAISHKLVIKYIDSQSLEPEVENNDPQRHRNAWEDLKQSDGVLVPGGFGDRGIEGKILAIEWARVNKKPFLGICLGLQCAVIEFARNVLNWKSANSTEVVSDCKTPVVIDMPEHNNGNLGGTMRVGKRRTIFRPEFESKIRQLYGNVDSVEERHRHRYEVNPEFVSNFNENGLTFVGTDSEQQRMEILELSDHPYFVAVQYHPEYLSRPLAPSPPFYGLLLASTGKLQTYLDSGCRLPPGNSSDSSASSSDSEYVKVKPFGDHLNGD